MKNRTAYEKEERKILREQIHAAVLDNQFSIRETELLEYQGFQLILPANMIKDKPYIWIKREGKYKVELGDSEVKES